MTRRIRAMRGDEGSNEERVTDTLLRDVRVLAIGQEIEAKEGKASDVNAKSATIELTPEQAEMLALAIGEISLSLRSIGDDEQKTKTSG